MITPTASTLNAYGLRCEQRVTPMGIDETRPRLGWRLRSSRRGDGPSGHRITVWEGSSAAAKRVWDSGWVDGDAVEAVYGGAPLISSTRYEWSLELHDLEGRATLPAMSWFETGVLHPDEWRASWIRFDPESRPAVEPPQDDDVLGQGALGHLNRRLPPTAYLRRGFVVDRPPVRARLTITSKGIYEARLNGSRVGDAELSPGWTDYRFRIQYQTYDVTNLLLVGENALGAILADGWWSGRVGPGGRKLGEHYGGAPELLAQMHLEFADGSRQLVVTDEAWVSTTGPLRYADLLAGEYYDARNELGSWDVPGFDDSTWSPVIRGAPDTTLLIAQIDEPVRVTERLAPVSVTVCPRGQRVVDLGQNIVGRVRLRIRGANRGAKIILRHAEMLTEEGLLYTENLRLASATDIYVASGRELEIFEPRFTFHGFRYIEVTGYPGELNPDDIEGIVLHSDTARVGNLVTSDPMVNQLLSNIWWGQRGNFVSIPTDCPQRDERLGWLADAQVFLPTACFNADVSAFFSRWMRDVVDGRLPSGAFPDVAPRLFFEREGAPGWGDAGVVIPWHLWRTYGDRRTLQRSFDAMAGWIDHIRRRNPDLCWRNGVGNHYGDWLQVDAVTPREVLATAYFAHSTALVAAAAAVLGRVADSEQYSTLAAAIRAAFVANFVAEDGTVTGDTQTCYLLALAFDLLPAHQVESAVNRLVDDLEARGRRLSTGFLGVSLLCPVLTRFGRTDLAYALLQQTAFPSWGYSIINGATTIWERWDGWTIEGGFQSTAMNSFNHYALGSVGEWLFQCVAGIDQHPNSVGYRELSIAPRPGGSLTSARARFDGPRGLIETEWWSDGQRLELMVEVPPGCTATVQVPTTDPTSVHEGDEPVWSRAEMQARDGQADAVACLVGSGRYVFHSDYLRIPSPIPMPLSKP
jgi:alpha-L-rhamnosidase